MQIHRVMSSGYDYTTAGHGTRRKKTERRSWGKKKQRTALLIAHSALFRRRVAKQNPQLMTTLHG
jgi:hypothetical protein